MIALLFTAVFVYVMFHITVVVLALTEAWVRGAYLTQPNAVELWNVILYGPIYIGLLLARGTRDVIRCLWRTARNTEPKDS